MNSAAEFKFIGYWIIAIQRQMTCKFNVTFPVQRYIFGEIFMKIQSVDFNMNFLTERNKQTDKSKT